MNRRDDLTAFADAHAESLGLLSETLPMLADTLPGVLYDVEVLLRIHSRMGGRIIDKITAAIDELQELEEQHSEAA